jgi:hypothetical protein
MAVVEKAIERGGDGRAVAQHFADFASDNIGLAREFISRPGTDGSVRRLAILAVLEQRALGSFTP